MTQFPVGGVNQRSALARTQVSAAQEQRSGQKKTPRPGWRRGVTTW